MHNNMLLTHGGVWYNCYCSNKWREEASKFLILLHTPSASVFISLFPCNDTEEKSLNIEVKWNTIEYLFLLKRQKTDIYTFTGQVYPNDNRKENIIYGGRTAGSISSNSDGPDCRDGSFCSQSRILQNFQALTRLR